MTVNNNDNKEDTKLENVHWFVHIFQKMHCIKSIQIKSLAETQGTKTTPNEH